MEGTGGKVRGIGPGRRECAVSIQRKLGKEWEISEEVRCIGTSKRNVVLVLRTDCGMSVGGIRREKLRCKTTQKRDPLIFRWNWGRSVK